MRAWYIGCASAFQADEPGSSPGARTNHGPIVYWLESPDFTRKEADRNRLGLPLDAAGLGPDEPLKLEELGSTPRAAANDGAASGEDPALIRRAGRIDTTLRHQFMLTMLDGKGRSGCEPGAFCSNQNVSTRYECGVAETCRPPKPCVAGSIPATRAKM